MTKVQLMKIGLTEEQAEKVLNVFKEELRCYIPKTRFDEVNEKKKHLEEQMRVREKLLADLQEKVKYNAEIEKAMKELQEANKSAIEKYEAKLKEMAINSAIQAKLTDAKYPDLLMTKFDRSELVVGFDGTVYGIDKQLAVLKETYKELFMPAEKRKASTGCNAGSQSKLRLQFA